MRIKSATTLLGVLVLSMACAGTKMSVMQPASRPAQSISRLAIAPGSGLLGDAIGLELFNGGLTVIDANEAGGIVARAGLTEFEITATGGLAALRDKGIEAVLIAKSVDGFDGWPESASIRVTNTGTGELIAGITWQNGWGGVRGSPADRHMRKSLSEAATEIARELLRRMGVKP